MQLPYYTVQSKKQGMSSKKISETSFSSCVYCSYHNKAIIYIHLIFFPLHHPFQIPSFLTSTSGGLVFLLSEWPRANYRVLAHISRSHLCGHQPDPIVSFSSPSTRKPQGRKLVVHAQAQRSAVELYSLENQLKSFPTKMDTVVVIGVEQETKVSWK